MPYKFLMASWKCITFQNAVKKQINEIKKTINLGIFITTLFGPIMDFAFFIRNMKYIFQNISKIFTCSNVLKESSISFSGWNLSPVME